MSFWRRTSRLRWKIGIAFAVLYPSFSLAQSGPVSLNIAGGLFEPNGAPIMSAQVAFELEILDPSGECVLYREFHPDQNLQEARGGFSLILGAGSAAQNLVDGGTSMQSNVFLNSGLLTVSGCAPLTLTSGEGRLIRVYYDLGSGYTAMTPDVPIVSTAYAQIANSVQGRTPADFLQVNGTSAGALNQANADYAFSLTNWPKLKDLLDGASAAYLPANPSSAVNLNGQRLTGIATPGSATDAVNKGYADNSLGGQSLDDSAVSATAGNGDTLIWNQSLAKWVAGAVSPGTAGGDLTGTYPNPTLANGAVTSAKIKSTGIAVNQLVITDGITGTTLTYAICNLNEVMKWTTSGWACTSVSTIVPVVSVAGKTGAVALSAGDIGGLGLAAVLDYGTAANELVRLDGGGHILASELPLIGAVKSVSAGAGLLGGPIVSSGTLSVNLGNAAGQIVGENANAQIAQLGASAAAPAYAFSTAADTGLFSPSSGALAFSASGTERARLANGGNFGVGTSVPARLLDVAGVIQATRGGSALGALISGQAGDGLFANNLYLDAGPIFYTSATSATNGFSAMDAKAGSIRFYTQGGATVADAAVTPSARLTIDSVGNVGIGNTGPSLPLDVTGSVLFRGPAIGGVDGELYYDVMAHAYKYYNAGSAAWQSLAGGTITYTGGTWGVNGSNVYYSAGNVGIGTTTPTAALGLGGGSARNIWMERNTTAGAAGNYLNVQAGGATSAGTDRNGGNLYLSAGIATGKGSSNIYLQTAAAQGASGSSDNSPSARVAILGNGNVGIGTTTPTSALHVGSGYPIERMGGVFSAGNGYMVGSYGMNVGWDGSNWTATSDTVHNGGALIAGSIWGGLNFYTFPSVGGGVQTIPDSSLNNYMRMSVSDVGMNHVGSISAGTSLAAGTTLTVPAIYGSGAAGGNLVLEATSNAAKGNVLIAAGGGKVGIGTAAPTVRLDVNGSALLRGPTIGGIDGELYFDSTVHAYKYYNALTATWQSLAGSPVTYTGSTWGLSGSNTYYNTGYVGIGTTAPADTLDVELTAGNSLRVVDTVSGAALAMQGGRLGFNTFNNGGGNTAITAGVTGSIWQDPTSGSFLFSTGTAAGSGSATTLSSRVAIGSAGLGIGLVAPTSPLHVQSPGYSTALVLLQNGSTISPPAYPSSLSPTMVVQSSETNGSRPLFFGYVNGSNWDAFLTSGACGSFGSMCFDLGQGSTVYTALKNSGSTLLIGGGAGSDGNFANVGVMPTSTAVTNASFLISGATTSLGITAGSYLYPFEVQASGGNTDRLQIAPYRRTAGSSYPGTAYRLQYAVDNSFTDGTKAFVEIGSDDLVTSGGGMIVLGTAGSDRMTVAHSGNVGIGTGTPGAKLDVAGHIANSGAAAGLGACGTSASLAGNDARGTVTVGTGAVTSCQVSFNSAYASAPICVVSWNGTGAPTTGISSVAATGTLTVYFSASSPGAVFNYHCLQ